MVIMSDKVILTRVSALSHGKDLDWIAQQTGIPPWKLQKVQEGRATFDRQEIGAILARFHIAVQDFDFGPSLGREDRFEVIEVCNGYQVVDTVTRQQHGLSDGVDVIEYDNPYGPHNWTVPAGTAILLSEWQEDMNADQELTLEAYFPEQFEKEKADE